jgi:hypothetical protein
VDEAAVAALLAKIAQARARPFAIGDGAIDDALGHGACVHTIVWIHHSGEAAIAASAGIHNQGQRLWIPGSRLRAPRNDHQVCVLRASG